MRTIELKEYGSSENFHESERPIPIPKKGEVRIRIHASAFNPLDYKLREGRYGGELPVILGSDCSGVIDAVGEGVEHFSIGDKVYAFLFTKASNGTYAEAVTVPEAFVCNKPQKLSFEEAASVPLAALTAYRLIVETRAVTKGDTVFISAGSGGVGSWAIELAREFGAKTICTTAGSDTSAEYLTKEHAIPAANILRYRGLSLKEREERVLDMNGGKPFSVCFDLVGGEMKHLCVSLCTIQGHVASILDEKMGFDLEVWNRKQSVAAQKSLSLHFCFIGAEDCFGGPDTWKVYHQNLSHLKELIEAGKLKVPRVTNLGPLSVETVKKAHALLEEGHVKGKLVASLGSDPDF